MVHVRIEKQMQRLQKKLAVAEALANERRVVSESQRAANQKIALDAVSVAFELKKLGEQLRSCEGQLEDARHELEKAQALAAGFRARAEKAESKHYALGGTPEKDGRVLELLHNIPTPIPHYMTKPEGAGRLDVDEDDLKLVNGWLQALAEARS